MRNAKKHSVLTLIISALLLTNANANAADINDRTIKLGYGITEDHPLGQGVKKFSEMVSERAEAE